jgi:hypothetical protein
MHFYYYKLSGGGINAQTINICTNFCTRDLTDTIAGIQIASAEITYCKKVSGNCILVNNFDVLYKENNCPNNPNGIDDCNDTLSKVLKIHVYYPSNHNYDACRLPAAILFHAGSYAECSSYDNPGIVALATKLCKRGFVVFNVNYRVGVIADMRVVPNLKLTYPKGIVTFTTAQQWLAIYRGMQDARGAIRSIIKMETDGTFGTQALPFKINENQILVGGTSAGSVLALGATFYKPQSKIDSIFPGVSNSLGPIDLEDVYYANPDEVDYFGKIIAVLNCWGALVTPATAGFFSDPYSFFANQGYELPSVISFHGLHDSTFNYQYQGVYFSTYDGRINGYGNLFRTESRCLSAQYSVNPNNDTLPDFIMIGSQTIYAMLHAHNISCELYLDCQAGHGLDNDDPSCVSCSTHPGDYTRKSDCSLCGYQSNYGVITANTQDKTYDYIAGRAATLFQAKLGGIASLLTTTKFVECPNYRNKCTPGSEADNNGGCNNEDVCP